MVYIDTDSIQTQLLPTNLRDIIADGHICYLIEELVHGLDYAAFDDLVSGPGAPSYHPRIKLKILIYGVVERVTSSRKLEKLTHENVIFRYLSESTHPDHHTIAMFRKNHGTLIEQCFLQTLFLARKLNLLNVNRLYLDGTKIAANASKKKNYSDEEVAFLTSFVKEHLEKMEETDEKEDKAYGKSNGEVIIPEHLRNKRKLKDAISILLNNPQKGLEKLDLARKNCSGDRINLSDPDSKLMRMKNGQTYKQAYNCQLLVEDKSEMIVSTKAFADPTDVGLAIPMIKDYAVKTGFGVEGIELSMDNGYMSLDNIRFFKKNDISAYIPTQSQAQLLKGKELPQFHVDNFALDEEQNQVICPAGQILHFSKKKCRKRGKQKVHMNLYKGTNCSQCRERANCIKGRSVNKQVEILPEIRIWSRKFFEKETQEIYRKRFHTGEIAQANILHNLAYREFKSRTLRSIQAELNLVAIAYNIKKIGNAKVAS